MCTEAMQLDVLSPVGLVYLHEPTRVHNSAQAKDSDDDDDVTVTVDRDRFMDEFFEQVGAGPPGLFLSTGVLGWAPLAPKAGPGGSHISAQQPVGTHG